MPDDFSDQQSGLSAPASHAAAVTPHDTTALTKTCRSLYVGGAGNVTVITAGGETVAFVGVPAGALLPVRATHVKSTGTSATSILALW